MASGKHIIAVEPDEAQNVADETGHAASVAADDSWYVDEAPAVSHRTGGLWAPLLAAALMLGWTAAFVASNWTAMRAGAGLAAWVGWIEGWSGPAMLIGIGWLLVIRTSKREVRRFGDAAAALEAESSRLETRLTHITRELSLAREFLASQARDLDSLGRVAVERIGGHAGQLQTLIHDNSRQIETIGTVSTNARENMELLRGQLPVIANAAKDVTNNIGNAGRVAHAQLHDLVNGLTRLNEFGLACERQVASVRQQVDESLALFDTRIVEIDALAHNRLSALDAASHALARQVAEAEGQALEAFTARAAQLDGQVADTRRQLEDEEAEALASLRARIAALRDEAAQVARALRDSEARATEAWHADVARIDEAAKSVSERIEATDRAAITTAQTRLAAFEASVSGVEQSLAELIAQADAEAAKREKAQVQRVVKLGAATSASAEQMAAIEARVQSIAGEIEQTQAQLAERLDRLTGSVTTSRQTIAETEGAVGALTDHAVRLLELIRASADHTATDLPAAITASAAKLVDLEARTAALHAVLGVAGTQGEALSGHVAATHESLAEAAQQIAELHLALGQTAADTGATFAELHTALGEVDSQTATLAARARGELTDAIAQLSGAAQEAVAGIETHGGRSISRVAEALGAESGAAIERAMHTHVAEIAGQLEAAAAHAAGVSREAAQQLRNQLAKVDELTGNLERRVTQARERAEEVVDNDFARRVALITESLNSAAVDITAALDTDVSDAAWAGYLRGDRGIFTRRAVKLLEAPEAKAVAQLYESDEAFHRHVSHYIHDFEAMLRQLLSTRDGHSLGVTLLSSDMGKLYVALAQAIDRLRG